METKAAYAKLKANHRIYQGRRICEPFTFLGLDSRSLLDMKILGLGYTQHECSAALVIDGVLRTAIARERVSRIKRDGSAWGSARLDLSSAINYCLQANNCRLDAIDLIVYNDYFHRSAEELRALLAGEGSLDVFSVPSIALPHHFAHACCSFYLSPFEEAAVFITDGAGGTAELIAKNCSGPEAESIAAGATMIQHIDEKVADKSSEYESFYHFHAGEWNILRKTIGKSHGIGAVYSRASLMLFGDDLDCGKTMGLSSYATPAAESMFLAKAGPEAIPFFRGDLPPALQNLEREIGRIMAANPNASKYEEAELQFYAATLQKETEDALIEYARWLQAKTGAKNLCMGGGVALNCVANSRIWDESGFDQVFVPPCPGDDGIAIGCALYGAALHGELTASQIPVFGGCSYKHDPSELGARHFGSE